MELTGHGTDNPGAADRAGHQRVHHADARSSALDLLSEVMTLVTFSVILWNLSGSLMRADPRRRRNSRLHDVGGACVYAVDRLLADLQDRPAAGADQLRPRALQCRLPLPHDREFARTPRASRSTRASRTRSGGWLGVSSAFTTTWWQYMNSDQAADLADRLLRPGRRHLPVPGRGPALLRRRDSRWACVMQTASAFGQVQSSLSWFVNQLRHAGATGRRPSTGSPASRERDGSHHAAAAGDQRASTSRRRRSRR